MNSGDCCWKNSVVLEVAVSSREHVGGGGGGECVLIKEFEYGGSLCLDNNVHMLVEELKFKDQ